MPRLIKTLQHYPISRDRDSGTSLTLNKITKILNLGCKNISKFAKMFGEFYGICAYMQIPVISPDHIIPTGHGRSR